MIEGIIQGKIAQARQEVEASQRHLKHLEEQASKASTKVGIKEWLDNDFESSSSLTPEFAKFSQDYKKQFNIPGLKLVNWSRGHFEVSGFLQNIDTGKLVYFSTSDVRYWPDDWYNHILIRTASHDHDYTGGSNCYTSLPDLPDKAFSMTS